MASLYIVRHGNTFEADELPRRVGRRTDLPLTATGRAQAIALGKAFASIRFARALCGELLRTRQTADLILAHQPQALPLETADVLTEIDHGPDENCTDSAIIARIGPQALAAWDEALVVPPDWLVDAPQRLAGWHALAQAALTAPGPLLLVTSNGAARFALKAFGQKTDKTSKLRTGAYGTLSAGPDTHYHVDTWDQRP